MVVLVAAGWWVFRQYEEYQVSQDVDAHFAAHGAAPAKRLSSRRSFTRNATLGAMGIVAAQIAGGFVWLLWPNQTGALGGEIAVSATNVPEAGEEPFRYAQGQFFVVHTEDGVLTLWWKCPHLGCTVPWIAGENRFICPCHGSVYEYNGERVSGPAPRGPDIMPVTVLDGGVILVDTNPSTIILGNADRSALAGEYTI